MWSFSVSVYKHLLYLILFSCISSAVAAQNQSESVYRFLTINPDARSAGLGGSHAAMINPTSAQFVINPAFLNRSETDRVYLSYLNHLGDIRYGTANYARELPGFGNVSASLRYLSYGALTRFDEMGNDLGSASANDLALTVGFGTSLTNQLSYGLSITGIHSSLIGYRSSAVSFSGGLLYNLEGRETSIGAYLNNAGAQITTYNGLSESLPLNLALGIAHRLQYIPVRLHFTLKNLNNWPLEYADDETIPSFFDALPRHITGGAEFLFGERVSARIGFDPWLNNQTRTGKRIDGAGFSFGFAIHLNTIDIDFSRTSFSDMGSVVQLGIGLKL
ncbi:type IX secretion system protein PorQ [Rhodohalobacter sp. 8-1]|uniref:type IX secretion system protein PorQ n=1 Tax=Rhodohalobacter sp. 8-1 TaxID=3131972 RepID=UPI0030EB9CCC